MSQSPPPFLSILTTTLTLILAGCTVAPMSLEESQKWREDFHHNLEFSAAEFDFHLGYRYGLAAIDRTKIREPGKPASYAPDLDEFFAILDTVTLGFEDGLQTLLLGMGGCIRKKCHVQNSQATGYNRGLGQVAGPNLSFYRFGLSNESPASLFAEANALFARVYGEDNCWHNGWSESRQYRSLTGLIWQPGKHYRYYFKCQTAGIAEPVGVEVTAILLEDHAFAYIESRCPAPPRRSKSEVVKEWIGCGSSIRDAFHTTKSGDLGEWVELLVEPTENPSKMQMVTSYLDTKTIEPSPVTLRNDLIRALERL